jgi:hypothetical protein
MDLDTDSCTDSKNKCGICDYTCICDLKHTVIDLQVNLLQKEVYCLDIEI